jgi:hypothetical protein
LNPQFVIGHFNWCEIAPGQMKNEKSQMENGKSDLYTTSPSLITSLSAFPAKHP